MEIKVGDKVRWFIWPVDYYETVCEFYSKDSFFTLERPYRRERNFPYVDAQNIGPEGWTIKRKSVNYPKKLLK